MVLSRSVLALATTILLLSVSFFAGFASASHDRGLFELDGNVADASAGAPYDWASTFSSSGTLLLAGAPLLVGVFGADHGAPDASYHAGSDKDIEDIPTWECATQNSPQDKTDLLNGYAALLRRSDGSDHLYFGVERATNNGNSFIGVWFLQNPTSCAVPPGASAGAFTTGHTTGDLLVLSDFTGGGSVSQISLYRWAPSSPNNLQLLASRADCSSASANDPVCGRVNGAALATPWLPGSASALSPNTFLEAGTNLTSVFGAAGVPCFSQLMFESRSSQELTAQLKDFILRDFRSCDARISVSPLAATNTVGDPHTFTFFVEKDLGTGAGWVPAAGETVTGRIASGPGSFVGASSCVTDATGRCSVTIVSTVAGATTLAGDVTVRIQSSSLVRTTDGANGNSPSAVKTWLHAPSVTTTVPTLASLVLGGSIADGIVVTGSVGTPTGVVDVSICAPDQVVDGGCPAGGSVVGEATLVDGEATSPAYTPTRVGTWCFRATYRGSDTYLASTDASPGECFEVTPGTPVLSSTSLPNLDGVVPGASVADSALVAAPAAGLAVPTGAVSFFLCGPDEVLAEGCPAGGAAAGSALLDAEGAAVSPATDATTTLGRYCWRVEYAGDANYLSASHTNGDSECFVVRDVDLSIAKSASVASAEPGDEITYTLTVTTAGNTPATNVVVRDLVPIRSTLLECDGCLHEGTAPGTELVWTIPSLEAPGSASVTFRVALDAVFPHGVTNVPNVASASSDQTEEVPSNIVVVPVTAQAALELVKGVAFPGDEPADELDAVPGDAVEFVLTLRSVGSAPATDIVVRDAVPDHSTLIDCDGCTAAGVTPGSELSWAVLELQPGDEVQLSFRVSLDASFPAGETVIPNVASVVSEQTPLQGSNLVEVIVVATPQLGLVKSSDAATASEGDKITFTLDAYNAGNGDVGAGVVTDVVPEGTEFVSCTGGCVHAAGIVTWTVGPLPAFTSPEEPAASVTLTVRVLDAHGCAACNVATIASPLQPGGPVESNLVCVDLVPDLDRANGAASALALRVTLGSQTLASEGERGVAQGGAGEVSDAGELLAAALPEDDSLVTARALRTATRATIAPEGGSALAFAETLEVSALDGAITASKVRAVAQTHVTSVGATFSSAGTAVTELRILGALYADAAPGTRIPLPAELFGAGSHVLVGAADGVASSPAGASGGFYGATLDAVGLLILVTDADPIAPGAQALRIEVSRATADAAFPQETPCEPGATTEAAATAAGMRAGGASIGSVQAPATGGADAASLAGASLDAGHARAVSTNAATTLAADGATALASAQVTDVCLVPAFFGCLVKADLVRAQARVDADAEGSTSDATGTRIVDLVVGGTPIDPAIEPNTVIDLPGVGFLVVDERLEGAGALTVRGLRLVVTEGALAGTEVVVAESIARASYA